LHYFTWEIKKLLISFNPKGMFHQITLKCRLFGPFKHHVNEIRRSNPNYEKFKKSFFKSPPNISPYNSYIHYIIVKFSMQNTYFTLRFNPRPTKEKSLSCFWCSGHELCQNSLRSENEKQGTDTWTKLIFSHNRKMCLIKKNLIIFILLHGDLASLYV
jgi:hypothetical protein